MNYAELNKNLKRCSKFDTCNKNLCPLDFELDLRIGKTSDKCRYMRKDRTSIMPDDLLIYVPENNVSRLNSISQKRHSQILMQNSRI
jgi:hypothetical protein